MTEIGFFIRRANNWVGRCDRAELAGLVMAWDPCEVAGWWLWCQLGGQWGGEPCTSVSARDPRTGLVAGAVMCYQGGGTSVFLGR